MSLPDTIFIFGLALVIFGPRKLPEIGRQMGKLLYEFRRASNEFKAQIEEELRAADEAERSNRAAIESSIDDQPIPEATVLSTESSQDPLPAESTTATEDADSTDLKQLATSTDEEIADPEEDWEWDSHKNYGDADSEPETLASEGESIEDESAVAGSTSSDSWERDHRDGWDDYRPEAEDPDSLAAETLRDSTEQPFQWEEAIEPETKAAKPETGAQELDDATEEQNRELAGETGGEPAGGQPVDASAFPALDGQAMSAAEFEQQEAEAANHHA